MEMTVGGWLLVDNDDDPITISELSVKLTKEMLVDGLCLSSLESNDFFIDTAQYLAELVGGDVCAKVPDLSFTSTGLGGQLKVRLEKMTAEHIACMHHRDRSDSQLTSCYYDCRWCLR
jgi:hypothetical protein